MTQEITSKPYYGAALFIELHEIDKKYRVKVSLRADPSIDLYHFCFNWILDLEICSLEVSPRKVVSIFSLQCRMGRGERKKRGNKGRGGTIFGLCYKFTLSINLIYRIL